MKGWVVFALLACNSGTPAPTAESRKPEPSKAVSVDARVERPPGPDDVSLDASKCEPGTKQHRYLGHGSHSVQVIGLEGAWCVYEAMTELEGGYAVSRCRVARTDGVVVMRAMGMAPGEPVGECSRTRQGSLFKDQQRQPSAKQ